MFLVFDYMKKLFILSVLALLTISCREENPAPSSFLEYNSPYYQSMDGALLKQLDEHLDLGLFGDIHSLIIIKDDQIVFENYYGNYSREDLHPIGSATASVVSAVVGTQLRADESFSLSQEIIDLFPEYGQFFDNIPQKDKINIRHLISHTSGFWWDEWMEPFGTDDNDAFIMSQSDEWVANVLATPMIKEPGSEFNFNSGNAVLMAPILEKASGVDLETLTKQRLFDPLSISEWKWDLIPDGYVNAAWGLHMKPIDMAKIGYLYLNNGKWNNEELFGETWASRSTFKRNWASTYFGHGYFWWGFGNNSDVARSVVENDIYFSWGSGGQYIFVVPHLNMVIVSTAGNYNNNDTITFDMLTEFIFKSVVYRYQ